MSKYAKTTEAAIRAEAARGITVKQAAANLGVSPFMLASTVVTLGIKFASKRVPADHDVVRAINELAEGRTLQAIAADMGVPYITLYQHLRRHGLPTSRVAAMQAKLNGG